MIRIVALFLWLLVPLCFWAATLIVGAPHVLTDQAYSHCTYLGWGPNWVTLSARDGSCWWVRFISEAG